MKTEVGLSSLKRRTRWLRLQHPSLGDHSLARQDGRVWRSIWALNTPPKVQNFLWRAYANILPTRANLQRRKVKVDAHCAICRHHEETVNHIL